MKIFCMILVVTLLFSAEAYRGFRITTIANYKNSDNSTKEEPNFRDGFTITSLNEYLKANPGALNFRKKTLFTIPNIKCPDGQRRDANAKCQPLIQIPDNILANASTD